MMTTGQEKSVEESQSNSSGESNELMGSRIQNNNNNNNNNNVDDLSMAFTTSLELASASVTPIEISRPQIYEYIVIIDFECTCDTNDRQLPTQEIIEFPAVLLKTDSLRVISHFHTYVKPVVFPILTPFCTELTGITQSVVDEQGCSLEDALNNFMDWLHSRIGNSSVAVASDGPWDFRDFLHKNCNALDIKPPSLFRQWINIRKPFMKLWHIHHDKDRYNNNNNNNNNKRKKLKQKQTKKESKILFSMKSLEPLNGTGIDKMLKYFNVEFEGRRHSGLDDARNICTIVMHLIRSGLTMKINENNQGSVPTSEK